MKVLQEGSLTIGALNDAERLAIINGILNLLTLAALGLRQRLASEAHNGQGESMTSIESQLESIRQELGELRANASAGMQPPSFKDSQM
jgi:hypothetical protein